MKKKEIAKIKTANATANEKYIRILAMASSQRVNEVPEELLVATEELEREGFVVARIRKYIGGPGGVLGNGHLLGITPRGRSFLLDLIHAEESASRLARSWRGLLMVAAGCVAASQIVLAVIDFLRYRNGQ